MGIQGHLFVRKSGPAGARGRSAPHRVANGDSYAPPGSLAAQQAPGQPTSVRRTRAGGIALASTDLPKLQRLIGNHAVQRLLVQRTVDHGAAPEGATIRRKPVTVLIGGKPYTFDDEAGSSGPASNRENEGHADGPIPIFDVNRRGSDLLKLTGSRSKPPVEEAPDPDAFTPKELEEMAEDEEFRRLPAQYNRVADELDTRYQALQAKLSLVSKDATALGLPNPLMSDLMDRERAIEKALVLPAHEINLRRFELAAEISRLETEVAGRQDRINDLKPLIAKFRQRSASVGSDLDLIEGVLEQNLKIKGRKAHLKATGELQKTYDSLNDQGLNAIARYHQGKAVASLGAAIEGLVALGKEVEEHGAVVEDADEATGGGLEKGSGSAKEIALTGRYGKLTKSVYSRLDSKLLPDTKLRDLLDSTTTGEGGQGVKALSGKVKGGFTYELKFLGKLGGNRIFGRMDSDGRVLFSKYGAHL